MASSIAVQCHRLIVQLYLTWHGGMGSCLSWPFVMSPLAAIGSGHTLVAAYLEKALSTAHSRNIKSLNSIISRHFIAIIAPRL